jgi:cytochrome P450
LQSNPETYLDDETIRRSVGGIIVGALDTTNKAIAQIVDQLLAHPDALHQAQKAAQANDTARVADIVWEAHRFNPQNPFLVRPGHAGLCHRRRHGSRGHHPGRQPVCAATLSAMFDPARVEKPNAFRPGRPRRQLSPLRLRPAHLLRRAHQQRPGALSSARHCSACPTCARPRRRGHIAYDGPFPNRLIVEWDA